MPIYDFGSVDETTCSRYNWGYDPINYNVPEGSYSTNPYDGSVRIREVKQMVQALHNAGIKVIMDVVYNHMFSPDNWFERIVPEYFLRRKPNGGVVERLRMRMRYGHGTCDVPPFCGGIRGVLGEGIPS